MGLGSGLQPAPELGLQPALGMGFGLELGFRLELGFGWDLGRDRMAAGAEPHGRCSPGPAGTGGGLQHPLAPNAP